MPVVYTGLKEKWHNWYSTALFLYKDEQALVRLSNREIPRREQRTTISLQMANNP